MRSLRIIDTNDNTMREYPDIAGARVLSSGALYVQLPPAPDLPALVILAPGQWRELEEWHTEPGPAEPADVPAEAPVSAPVWQQLTGEVPALLARADDDTLTDRDRVHIAMAIQCVCAELRCPVVLNPPTPQENRPGGMFRRAVKARPDIAEVGKAAFLAGAGVPVHQQCVFEVGHDTATQPHAWMEGVWVFGPSNHHPKCPRHPENYNRRPQEGQPQHAAGVTSATVLPTQAPEPADGPLSRPYVNASVWPVRRINEQVRASFQICATLPPEEYGDAFHCQDSIGHAGPHHALQGGERVDW